MTIRIISSLPLRPSGTSPNKLGEGCDPFHRPALLGEYPEGRRENFGSLQEGF